jgi:hypothetical protein
MFGTHSTRFLRVVLLLDAAASGATAAPLLLAAAPLEGLLGLPAALMRVAGLILIPFAAFVLYVATREPHVHGAVAAIIFANVAWVVASIALLLGGWVAPTALGYAFVIVQAMAVGIFAELQVTGLRRHAAAAV